LHPKDHSENASVMTQALSWVDGRALIKGKVGLIFSDMRMPHCNRGVAPSQ